MNRSKSEESIIRSEQNLDRMELTVIDLNNENKQKKKRKSYRVEVRVVFLTIQNIDTSKDCFTADIYIEARWRYNPPRDLSELGTHFKPEWKPDLKISNMVEKFNIEKWYRLGENNDGIYAFEMQKIKGRFYERLELNHYPFDAQDLTIDVVASESLNICSLEKHPYKMSYVITDDFRSAQEWYLYDYVGTQDNQVDKTTKYSIDDSQYSLMKFSCYVARIPTYFFWNAFFLIFLITVISFCPFAVPIAKQDSRLIISVTLMLTSVSFKWTVNRSLPPISYLTTLDIYSIFGIAWTTTLAAWHALYGYFYTIWIHNTWIDKGFLIGMAGLFVIINLLFLVLLFFEIYRPRRLGQERQNVFVKEFKEGTTRAMTNTMKWLLSSEKIQN